MSKIYKIIALITIFGVWHGSDAMKPTQTYYQGQLTDIFPTYESVQQTTTPHTRAFPGYPTMLQPTAPIQSQSKMRQQPKEEAMSFEGFEPTEMSIEEEQATIPPVLPIYLKNIANDTIVLWNLYKNAKRTTNNIFSHADWEKMANRFDALEKDIVQSTSQYLLSIWRDFKPLLDSIDLYDEAAFGQALNEILLGVNKVIEVNPAFYSPQYVKQFALNDVPYILSFEEPSMFYSAQRTITAPVSAAYDWTKGAVGGVISTGYDWARWGASSIGSGLSSIKQSFTPISEEEKMVLEKRLILINKEIKRLEDKRKTGKINSAEQTKLQKLILLKSQYESRMRGWGPALATGAALAAGAYLYR